MKTRRISDTDVAAVRRLRLAALADAPDAFAATLEQALAMPDSRWADVVRANAEGIANVAFIAESETCSCGLVVGVWRGGEPATVVLNALWVAPHARGHGVARELVSAVEHWARERGARRVELEVTETSQAARALYASAGYEVVQGPQPSCGERRALASKLCKTLS